jgi:hypothetical protein
MNGNLRAAVRTPFGYSHGPELVEGRLQPRREKAYKQGASAPEALFQFFPLHHFTCL